MKEYEKLIKYFARNVADKTKNGYEYDDAFQDLCITFLENSEQPVPTGYTKQSYLKNQLYFAHLHFIDGYYKHVDVKNRRDPLFYTNEMDTQFEDKLTNQIVAETFISGMSEQMQAVFKLKAYGYTYDEIEEKLKVPAKETVRKIYNYTRKREYLLAV